MKTLTLLLASLLLALALPLSAQQAGAQPITNESVIEMLQAGLGPEIVIASFEANPTDFKLAPADLMELKVAGVPDAVIAAMLKKSNSPPVTAAQPKTGAQPQTAAFGQLPLPAETGVFLRRPDKYEFLQKEETENNMSSGKGLGYIGVTKMKMTYFLSGESAGVKLTTQPAVLLIYLPDVQRKLQLVRAKIKDGKRILATEEARLGLLQHKVKYEEMVETATTVLAPNYLELKTAKPLQPGEYAVIDIGDQGQAPKVWCFSAVK